MIDTKGYTFESILLQSERLDKDIEMVNNVTDLEIYESLDKPFLTGRLAILDNDYLYEDASIIGGERITVEIKSTKKKGRDEQDTLKVIKKTFYVDKVLSNRKVQDNAQVIIIDLVEDLYFQSSLMNINRYYSGKLHEIIKKIAGEFLDKEVDCANNDRELYKLIVPNMTPIQAMRWLADRSMSVTGYPYYLFSTLVKDKLFLKDMKTVLEQPPINPEAFTNNSLNISQSGEVPQKREIKSYKIEPSDDLLFLIQKGLVGANYQYIDTADEKLTEFEYDIRFDSIDKLKNEGLLNEPNFSSKYEYKGKSFNSHRSRLISQIGGTYAYREDDNNDYDLSLGESRNQAKYLDNVSVRAFDNLLKKNPLTFVVPGIDFIDGDKHSTIGNNLELVITSAAPGSQDHQSDTRLSGNYLVYYARHSFSKEAYNITMTGVKMNGKQNDS